MVAIAAGNANLDACDSTPAAAVQGGESPHASPSVLWLCVVDEWMGGWVGEICGSCSHPVSAAASAIHALFARGFSPLAVLSRSPNCRCLDGLGHSSLVLQLRPLCGCICSWCGVRERATTSALPCCRKAGELYFLSHTAMLRHPIQPVSSWCVVFNWPPPLPPTPTSGQNPELRDVWPLRGLVRNQHGDSFRCWSCGSSTPGVILCSTWAGR